MNRLVGTAKEIVDLILGSPQSSQETYFLQLLAFFTAIIIYGWMTQALNVPRTGPGITVGMVLLGMIGALLGMVVFRLYAAHFFPTGLQVWATLSAGGVITLVLLVPVMKAIHHASYSTVLVAWGSALLVAGFMVVIGRVGYDFVHSGSEKAHETKARSEEMQEFINRQ